MSRTAFLFVLVPFLLTFLSCHQNRPYDNDTAILKLKSLNSDLINLASKAEEANVYKQLKFLLNEPSSPVYLENGLPSGWLFGKPVQQNFFGIYEWDDATNGFVLTDTSRNIQITLPEFISGQTRTKFSMPAFNCQSFRGNDCIPPELQAFITNDSDTTLRFSETISFADDMPQAVHLYLMAKGLGCMAKANRTRIGDRGTLDIELTMASNGHEFIHGTIKSEIGYNGSMFYYKTITTNIQVFQVKMTGLLDYSKVNPTGRDYISSFNNNCRIRLSDAISGREIGRIGIGTREETGLMGWVLFLSDGQPVFLEDYLVLLRKILNFKYPNRFPAS